MDTQTKPHAATVYPSRPGAFAPFTALSYAAEFDYMREAQQRPGKFGIVSAPARTFTETHPDTFRKLAEYVANN